MFYGCFDWHSAVHSHWLLVRVLKEAPDEVLAEEIAEALSTSFEPAKLRAEAEYLCADGRAPFERPYGLAWLLQLAAELRDWEDKRGRCWAAALEPLELAAVRNIRRWLAHLQHPVRSGTHSQTAFAFALFLDWAATVGDREMKDRVAEKALSFHADDTDAPIRYEPSGEDFLSPTLMEADLMRRVLTRAEFAAWLARFLPAIPLDGRGDWLSLARVTDETDGRLIHLHGLNLSRAWNLRGIAAALPPQDPRVDALRASAEAHKEAGLGGISGEHYAGSHWLATFGLYLLSQETSR